MSTRSTAFALCLVLGACAEKGGPEQVADDFADAYFRKADQEKAKEYTALGATSMLDAELREVSEVRGVEGYEPGQSRSEVEVHRGSALSRDQRVRFPFEIIIKAEGRETVRQADVELAQIQGAWKVVRVGFTNP